MHQVTSVCRAPPDVEASLYPFTVVTERVTYQLAATTRHDEDAWVAAIEAAVDSARGHDRHGPGRDVR